MRVFEKFNPAGDPCPICSTRDETQTVLIGVAGTEKGGNIMAVQIHLECLDPVIVTVAGKTMLVQSVGR
jgi:hypothetical protein